MRHAQKPTVEEIAAQVERLSFHLGTEVHHLLVFLTGLKYDREYSVKELSGFYYEGNDDNEAQSRLRSLARSLRNALESYYARWRTGEIKGGHGNAAESIVHIAIPHAHGYKPSFDWRDRDDTANGGATSDVHETFTTFPQDEVQRLIASPEGVCKKINLCASWFPPLSGWANVCRTALKSGATMKIILSHPDSAFARYRGLAVWDNPPAGPPRILGLRSQLKELKPYGPLLVKLTDIPLPHFHVQVGDDIYFTMFWSDRNAVEGPWCKVKADRPFGRKLVEQFDIVWQIAQPDDLEEQPPAMIDHLHTPRPVFPSSDQNL